MYLSGGVQRAESLLRFPGKRPPWYVRVHHIACAPDRLSARDVRAVQGCAAMVIRGVELNFEAEFWIWRVRCDVGNHSGVIIRWILSGHAGAWVVLPHLDASP